MYEPTEVDKYKEQEEYLQILRKRSDFFEVRLGRLKKDGKGLFRQKGVDTLIAIDMLSKAYENHYDVAAIFSGDEDLLDVVTAVKNAGKQVYGIYFADHQRSWSIVLMFGLDWMRMMHDSLWLRTAVANEYKLDKEQTSYHDLLMPLD
jgi:uncharacterized LabA/DUF88 family protein